MQIRLLQAYFLILPLATVPDDVIPQDFTKDTVTCQGQQVECLRFEKGTLTLVYLTTPSTEVKNTLHFQILRSTGLTKHIPEAAPSLPGDSI